MRALDSSMRESAEDRQPLVARGCPAFSNGAPGEEPSRAPLLRVTREQMTHLSLREERLKFNRVDPTGVEPVTSSLQMRRSTN